MDSRRSSSSEGEWKLDKATLESGAASTNMADNAGDLEKGLEAPIPPPSDDVKKQDDAFLVKWEENDPANPRNWNSWFKAWITLQLGILAFVGSFGSSVIAPAEGFIADDFGVSTEATVLCVALYVLGFALGPSLWAPISEVYGRKMSILPAVFLLGIFSIATATSNSAASVFVTRFFGGVFASAPISNVAAALGDMYEPGVRGTAVTFYAVCVCGGPTIGPTVGAALVTAGSLSWRWTEYVEAILVAAVLVLGIITLPEMYPPVLLKRKAKRLRKETSDSRYWHPHESEKIKVSNMFTKYLSRPLRMLVTEPMVTCIAIYASFVYGLLYMTLEMFPIVYAEERGWSLLLSSLPFLGLLVGVIAAMGINLANQPAYIRAVERNKGKAVPEARLPPMIIGGVLFVIGLFWFAWTANPKIHWAVPTVATAFIGAGFNVIFQQCINFLVDTYALYAASATSANTILRSFMACGLPLAVKPMFRAIGVGPAVSILGAFATLLLPVPLLFQRYGVRLRQMSKFAPQGA